MSGCGVEMPVEAVIVHTNLLVVAAIFVERMTGCGAVAGPAASDHHGDDTLLFRLKRCSVHGKARVTLLGAKEPDFA
jgi:hypothetical protein